MTGFPRRTLLTVGASAALTPLAGCTDTDIPFGPAESTSIFLTNRADEERTVTVTVDAVGGDEDENEDEGEGEDADENGNRLLEETVTVDPDETHGISDPVDEAVRVTVRVEDGPEETYEWTETGPEHALSISLGAESIGFSVATEA